MTEKAYSKLTIARTQLDTALRLYEEGNDLFSVVTLAGAAEVILGQLLKVEKGADHSLDELVQGARAVSKEVFDEDLEPKVVVSLANRARNAFKHHDPEDPTSVTVSLEEEAEDMLTRAVDNYWSLTRDLTPPMKQFNDARRS